MTAVFDGHGPVVSWTPAESWLFAEMAAAALTARLDEGTEEVRATREDEGAFRVEIHGDSADISLVVHLACARATLALRPRVVGGNRWRDEWALELWRGTSERWLIAAGDAPVEIANASREPLRGWLLRRTRFLDAPGGDEVVRVRLEEQAFHKYTRQSSIVPRTDADALAGPGATQPEAAPFWEIDLGQSVFVHSVAVDLARVPPGARVRIAGYAYPTPAGECPDLAPAVVLAGDALAPDEHGLTALRFTPAWVARYVRVEMTADDGADVALAVAGCAIAAAGLFGDSLRATWRRALALHHDRVFLAARDGDDGAFVPVMTYGELGRRARAFARGLARRLERDHAAAGERARVFLALATRSRVEWVIADVAAVERGYVVVPLAPDEPDDRLASILSRCPPAAVLVEARDLARLSRVARAACATPPVFVVCDAAAGEPGVAFEEITLEGESHLDVPDAPLPPGEALYSVLFTSGSTGAPKGAMRSYDGFNAMLTTYGVVQPAHHLSFQPLSHLSERMFLPALVAHGGTLAFSRGAAHLTSELRAFEPTMLGSVPRLYDLLYAGYQRRLRAAEQASPDVPRARLEADAMAEARGAFGRRLLSLGVGSAPVSPAVLAFLRATFADIWVTEGYGTTELGTIASDGKVSPRVDVKIIPVGEPSADGVERGEILARTPHMIAGYFGDAAASAAALDADGYFRTGDLGERGADGRVRVVGRLKSAVKLAQGEFVACERVESALASAALVDRVFVHVEPGAPGVAALVFPRREALARALGAGEESLEALVARGDAAGVVLGALVLHGQRAGLAAYELPRGVVLSAEAPTVEEGTLTASGKLARGALASRYGARLAAAAAHGPGATSAELTDTVDDGSLAARFARVAGALLGRAVSPREPLGASLDSLAAAEVLAALAADLGRPIALARWFAARTLEDLAHAVTPFGASDAPSALEDEARRDLALPPPFERMAARATAAPRRVLLTGATGFLGAHLLEALARDTALEVVCLVRARDEAHARARLNAALEGYAIAAVTPDRVITLAGDLAAPALGLGEPGFAALAARVDLVLHAGAVVSWLAPYDALRAANVGGTRELLRLAAAGASTAVHLVSTISTAPADGDEDSALTLAEVARTSPYAVSKWLAEQHARAAAARGLPVAVYRPAMIAAHSARGVGNPEDFIQRYVAGCADLGLALDLADARLDMTPVDFVARAVVALMADAPAGCRTHHLANVAHSPTYAALGDALRAAGLAVDRASYDTFRAALVGAHHGDALRALAAYFPEERFALAMGPWPDARTRARLAALDVRCPEIDTGYIARMVSALRDRGGISPRRV